MVDGDNGFLLPVKDVAALKDAMEWMGEASLRRVSDKYDVHKLNSIIMGAMGL